VSNLGTIAIAFLSWIVFNTIGQPLLRFFDLRTEIRRVVVLYDNVTTRRRDAAALAVAVDDMTPDNFGRLQEAENQYRHLASQVRAFADTQSPTCIVLRWFGFDLRKASSGLLGLSNTINTYGKGRAFHKESINTAMKFPAASRSSEQSHRHCTAASVRPPTGAGAPDRRIASTSRKHFDIGRPAKPIGLLRSIDIARLGAQFSHGCRRGG
jgi:hypothetical protein